MKEAAIYLYEYQNKVSYDHDETPIDIDALELYLEQIWNNREKSDYFRKDEDSAEEEDKIEEQRFLQILRRSKELKSNKYVGVIHFEGQRINLLPKIFYHPNSENKTSVKDIQLHILWWLSYCEKIRFPSYEANLSSIDSDFFEILTYLFAKYTRELLSSAIYQQYQEVDRELSFVKGRINTNRYIDQNLSRGRWHKINCTYDSFEVDNTFNRVIKYVATLLIGVSKNTDSQKYLREIIFILDEVDDRVMTSSDCSALKFNPMFSDFEKVRDYCQLFLDHSISFDYKTDLKLFAFLLPMEVLFEDFIKGFIQKEVYDISFKSQVSGGYLAKLGKESHFKLRPDLLLKVEDRPIIGDTKYKILDRYSKVPKYGISQSDMYQMVSYAISMKITQIVLIYPKPSWRLDIINEEFIIHDSLAIQDISVRVCEIPITCDLDENLSNGNLTIFFENLVSKLSLSISGVF